MRCRRKDALSTGTSTEAEKNGREGKGCVCVCVCVCVNATSCSEGNGYFVVDDDATPGCMCLLSPARFRERERGTERNGRGVSGFF